MPSPASEIDGFIEHGDEITHHAPFFSHMPVRVYRLVLECTAYGQLDIPVHGSIGYRSAMLYLYQSSIANSIHKWVNSRSLHPTLSSLRYTTLFRCP